MLAPLEGWHPVRITHVKDTSSEILSAAVILVTMTPASDIITIPTSGSRGGSGTSQRRFQPTQKEGHQMLFRQIFPENTWKIGSRKLNRERLKFYYVYPPLWRFLYTWLAFSASLHHVNSDLRTWGWRVTSVCLPGTGSPGYLCAFFSSYRICFKRPMLQPPACKRSIQLRTITRG